MTEWASVGIAVLAIVGSGVATIGALVWWLAERFRSLEKLIYRELKHEREAIDAVHSDIYARVYQLEYKANGHVKFGPPARPHPPRGTSN